MNRFDLRAGAALAGSLLLALPLVQVAHDFVDAGPKHLAMTALAFALIAYAGSKA
jgi:hypothetical protein